MLAVFRIVLTVYFEEVYLKNASLVLEKCFVSKTINNILSDNCE